MHIYIMYLLSLLSYEPCMPLRLRALPIINTCFTHLRAHAPLLLSIGALRAVVLTCVELLLLKCRICFVCALQLTIHLQLTINHSPPSLSSLLLYHINYFSCFFSYLLFFKPLVTKLFLQ